MLADTHTFDSEWKWVSGPSVHSAVSGYFPRQNCSRCLKGWGCSAGQYRKTAACTNPSSLSTPKNNKHDKKKETKSSGNTNFASIKLIATSTECRPLFDMCMNLKLKEQLPTPTPQPTSHSKVRGISTDIQCMCVIHTHCIIIIDWRHRHCHLLSLGLQLAADSPRRFPETVGGHCSSFSLGGLDTNNLVGYKLLGAPFWIWEEALRWLREFLHCLRGVSRFEWRSVDIGTRASCCNFSVQHRDISSAAAGFFGSLSWPRGRNWRRWLLFRLGWFLGGCPCLLWHGWSSSLSWWWPRGLWVCIDAGTHSLSAVSRRRCNYFRRGEQRLCFCPTTGAAVGHSTIYFFADFWFVRCPSTVFAERRPSSLLWLDRGFNDLTCIPRSWRRHIFSITDCCATKSQCWCSCTCIQPRAVLASSAAPNHWQIVFTATWWWFLFLWGSSSFPFAAAAALWVHGFSGNWKRCFLRDRVLLQRLPSGSSLSRSSCRLSAGGFPPWWLHRVRSCAFRLAGVTALLAVGSRRFHCAGVLCRPHSAGSLRRPWGIPLAVLAAFIFPNKADLCINVAVLLGPCWKRFRKKIHTT